MTAAGRSLPFNAIYLALFLVTACGDSVDSDIETAMAGGEAGDAAMIRLSLSASDVIPPIIAAIGDSSNSAAGRIILLELMRRIYVREADPRILGELGQIASNPDVAIRKAAIRALGDVGQTEQLVWLSGNLEQERDPDALRESLQSISTLGKWQITSGRNGFWVVGGQNLRGEQTAALQDQVRRIYLGADDDSLRTVAEELLEKFVCQEAQEAEERELGADLHGAEAGFRRALELSPASRNAVRRHAMFLLRSGDAETGRRILAANNMTVTIPHRRRGPVVDGVLDEAEWQGAARIDRYQKTLKIMRTIADDGNTHGYFTYTDSTLCIGMIRYGIDVGKLQSKYTERDGWTWEDDHFMVRIVAGIDEVREYVYFINPLGTVRDSSDGGPNAGGGSWNGEHSIATHVGEDSWSMELEVPFSNFGESGVAKGDMWLLNTGWGNTATSIHAAWICNHGVSSRRMGLVLFD